MGQTASVEMMKEFWDSCLMKLDRQVFGLKSEKAKKCAIQAVQRTLNYYLRKEGEEFVLRIIKYEIWNLENREK